MVHGVHHVRSLVTLMGLVEGMQLPKTVKALEGSAVTAIIHTHYHSRLLFPQPYH